MATKNKVNVVNPKNVTVKKVVKIVNTNPETSKNASNDLNGVIKENKTDVNKIENPSENNKIENPVENNPSNNNNNTEVIKENNIVNNNPNNKPKKPKKKGWWSCLGFSERFLIILIMVFTVGAVGGITLHTYVVDKSYTVTFDPNYEGAEIEKKIVKKGNQVDKPNEPQRENYGFLGWRKDKEKNEYYNFSDKVTSDFTLYGTWGKMLTVTLDLNYPGSTPITKKVVESKSLGKVDTPLRNEYVFLDWYKDKACTTKFDLSTPIIADTTLYASWRAEYKYTVVFNLNYDGASKIDPIQISEGKKIERIKDPERQYYKFNNWYKEKTCENLFDFDAVMTGEPKGQIEIFAKWDEIKYTATFYLKRWEEKYEQFGAPEEITMSEKSKFTYREPSEYIHYTFDGWYTSEEGGEKYDFTKDATGSVNLYSRYSRTICKVSLYQNDGSGTEPKIVEVKHGDAMPTPEDPTRTGYRFLGWFTDINYGEKFDFSTTIEQETLNLYAHWSKLTLDSIVVKDIQSSTFAVGDTITKDNFVVTAIYGDASEETIAYDSTGKNGYKITNFELPHTFKADEVQDKLGIVFNYTFESAEKSFTIYVDVVLNKFEILPINSSGTVTHLSRNINYKPHNYYGYACFELGAFKSQTDYDNIEVSCRSDLTGEEISITKKWFKYDFTDNYGLKVEMPSDNQFYGSATITAKHKTDGAVDSVGSIKVEVGTYYGFTFLENSNNLGTCSMGINEKITHDDESFDVVTPGKYYYDNLDRSCGCFEVTKVRMVSEEKRTERTYENFYKSIILTDNIVELDEYAFYSQESLISATVSKNIDTLPYFSFCGCDKLANLELKYGIKCIGEYAFKNDGSLQKVVVPDSVIEIKSSAFSMIGSYNRKATLTLSKNLEKIDTHAFYQAYLYTSTITLPLTLKYIGPGAFREDTYYKTDFKYQFDSSCTNNWNLYVYKYKNPPEFYKEIDSEEIDDVEESTKLLKYSTEDGGYSDYIWMRVTPSQI